MLVFAKQVSEIIIELEMYMCDAFTEFDCMANCYFVLLFVFATDTFNQSLCLNRIMMHTMRIKKRNITLNVQ